MSRRRLVTARRRTTATAASPTDVPSLVYRWRADSITAANGAAVASWPALAGGVALAASGSAQPTYVASGINGQPTVRFNGTSTRMDANLAAFAQPVTVMAVAKLASASGSHMIYNAEGVELYAEGGLWVGWGGAELAAGATDTSPAALVFVANGASSTVNRNGTAVTGSAGTTGHNATVNVGDYSAGGYRLNGDVAEICVYQRALSTAEINTLRSYTTARYGTP